MAKFHQGIPTRLDVLAQQVLTVGTSPASLTPPTFNDLLGVLIEVQGAAVRYFMDASNPTATLGHYLAAGDTATLFINPARLRFIRDTTASVDATLVVAYLGV